jgi:alpha-glucosidase
MVALPTPVASTRATPPAAFHFGSGYTSIGKRRYVFTWNRDKFPEPRAAIEKFRQKNARVVVNLKPCLLDDHPAYEEVAARGGFVEDSATGRPCIGQFWDGEGAHVDFTNPEGIAWWQESLRQQVLDYGVDAGWNDNNEYEIWEDSAVSHGFGHSLPIQRSRPLQTLLMTRATAEAQAAHRPGERVYMVTRAGPPGIQRYAQTWSGDNATSWHTLRWNLRMGLSMSRCGMFDTGHDVGGFIRAGDNAGGDHADRASGRPLRAFVSRGRGAVAFERTPRGLVARERSEAGSRKVNAA